MLCVSEMFRIDFAFSRLCWTHYVLRVPSNSDSLIFCCTIVLSSRILKKLLQWVNLGSWLSRWVMLSCWTSAQFMRRQRGRSKRNVEILSSSLWLMGKLGILDMWRKISVWLSNTWSPNCKWLLLSRKNMCQIMIMRFVLPRLRLIRRLMLRKNKRILSRISKLHIKSKSEGLELS